MAADYPGPPVPKRLGLAGYGGGYREPEAATVMDDSRTGATLTQAPRAQGADGGPDFHRVPVPPHLPGIEHLI